MSHPLFPGSAPPQQRFSGSSEISPSDGKRGSDGESLVSIPKTQIRLRGRGEETVRVDSVSGCSSVRRILQGQRVRRRRCRRSGSRLLRQKLDANGIAQICGIIQAEGRSAIFRLSK